MWPIFSPPTLRIACSTWFYNVAFEVLVFLRRFWDGPWTSHKYTMIGAKIYCCAGQFLHARFLAILKIYMVGTKVCTLGVCPNFAIWWSWNHIIGVIMSLVYYISTELNNLSFGCSLFWTIVSHRVLKVWILGNLVSSFKFLVCTPLAGYFKC